MSDRLLPGPPPAAAALSAVFGLAGWCAGADGPEQAVLIARFTARVSLGLFLIVFLLGPARRGWLSGFVAAHLLHLAAMVHLTQATHHVMPPHYVVLGLAAYALPAVVLFLPGRRNAIWRWLALGYVWLSFAVTYYQRLFEFPDRRLAGAIAFWLLIAALFGRLALAFRPPRPAPRSPSSTTPRPPRLR